MENPIKMDDLGVSSNPQIIPFVHRVWNHYFNFNHPFWRKTPYFWFNTLFIGFGTFSIINLPSILGVKSTPYFWFNTQVVFMGLLDLNIGPSGVPNP